LRDPIVGKTKICYEDEKTCGQLSHPNAELNKIRVVEACLVHCPALVNRYVNTCIDLAFLRRDQHSGKLMVCLHTGLGNECQTKKNSVKMKLKHEWEHGQQLVPMGAQLPSFQADKIFSICW
jgi:hypothetical protein